MPVESFFFTGGKFQCASRKFLVYRWKVSCLAVESFLCTSRKFLTENSHRTLGSEAPDAALESPVRSRLLA